MGLPSRNDVLRAPSVTPVLDTVASVLQVLAVAALCVLRPKKKLTPVSVCITAAFVLLYYACWGVYYAGVAHVAVLFAMIVLPCAALLWFSLTRRNLPALCFAAAFFVCHFIYGAANFLA